jgi:prepilin-type processing-associated H-X9-DG protein
MCVVIAIIAVLAAICLPVLHMAQQSAANAACMSNLRQLGQGFQLHLQARGFFPHGGFSYQSQPTYFTADGHLTLQGVPGPNEPDPGKALHGTPGTGARPQFGGWAFQILPFIGEDQSFTSGVQRVVSTGHAVLRCPQRDADPITVPNFTVNNPSYFQLRIPGDTLTVPRCDYASAFAGKYLRATGAPPDYFVRYPTGPDPETSGVVRRARPGGASPKVKGIVDGASNTILIGEKLMSAQGPGPADSDQGFAFGWDIDVNRSTSFPPEPDFPEPPITLAEYAMDLNSSNARLYKFGSPHTSGVNFVMADGSVRTISYAINAQVFESLGHSFDREPLGSDWDKP